MYFGALDSLACFDKGPRGRTKVQLLRGGGTDRPTAMQVVGIRPFYHSPDPKSLIVRIKVYAGGLPPQGLPKAEIG